jgi:cyclohexadieny/prephenate dehydrogenase
VLDRFNRDLAKLTHAIGGRWRHAVRALHPHRAIRRGIVAIGQDSEAPDFGRPRPSLPSEPLPRPYASEEG